MSVTMQQIDIRRDHSKDLLTEMRFCQTDKCLECFKLRRELELVRAEIDSLLREWWKQDCKEVSK